MPILKGKFTAHVFSVSAAETPTFEALAEGLTEHAFRVPPQAAWKNASGWANLEQWIESDFDDRDRWVSGSVIFFNLRQDTRTLPKSFKQRLAQRVKAWCKMNTREKCPAGVKSDLKETLELEILPTVTPRTTLVEVAWDLGEGRLYIAGKGMRLEATRKLFFKTFGLVAEVATGLDTISLAEVTQLAGAFPLVPGEALSLPDREEGNDEPVTAYAEMPVLPTFGGDFLLWLWHRSTEGLITSLGGQSVAVWVDQRVVLASGEWSATVRGDAALRDREVFIALAAGRRIQGLTLTVRRDDQEYTYDVTDALDGPLAVKVPGLLKHGDVGERMLDRMFVAGVAWAGITELIEQYAHARLDVVAFESTMSAITLWVNEQAHVQTT